MAIERVELLKKMDRLTEEHCEKCPNKNKGTAACESCGAYAEFRKIGDKFDAEAKAKRNKMRQANAKKVKKKRKKSRGSGAKEKIYVFYKDGKAKHEGTIQELAAVTGYSVNTMRTYSQNWWLSQDKPIKVLRKDKIK